MRTHLKFIIGAAVAAAVASPVGVAPALAGSDYGPNTCLDGFVWREAFNGDVTCVTPATRARAAADNAAADSRRSPTGGEYGPNTCLSPFVWRVTRPSDLVCVTVPTRSQVAADNAAAASRRDSILTDLYRWTSSNTTTCDGGTCTTQNDSATFHRVVVTNINVGQAIVHLYRSSDRREIRSWRVTSSPVAGRVGGRVDLKTRQLVCAGTPNAHFRVTDPSSGRVSAQRFVRVGCATL